MDFSGEAATASELTNIQDARGRKSSRANTALLSTSDFDDGGRREGLVRRAPPGRPPPFGGPAPQRAWGRTRALSPAEPASPVRGSGTPGAPGCGLLQTPFSS